MKKSFGLKSISGMHIRTSNSGGGLVGIASSGLTLHFDGANASSNTGSGNTWYNLAGGTNMTLMPSATRSTDGGNSFVVGNAGYARLYTSSGTGLGVRTGDFSMSIWFKMANLGVRNQIIISQYAAWLSSCDIVLRYIQSSQSVSCFLGDGIQVNLSSTANSITSTSVWYNICVVRTSGVTKLYLNDVEKSSSSSVADIKNFASEMWLGGNWQQDEFMVDNAKIGHFSFYNRALSSTERTQNFNALKTRFGL